jgi:hypothetical protein
MPASAALRLEEILSKALAAKPGSRLLAGLGARISVASALAPRAEPAEPLAVVEPLDCLLAGGLPKGKLTEFVGRRSSGRFAIALAALASATSSGEAAALVDLDSHLDPQGAAAAGVDLERLLWVRPRRAKEALASAEILLATGFALVVVDLGLFPRGARYLPDAVWVRLARAAQSRGASLLLLTPWRVSGIAAAAVVTAERARPLWHGADKTPPLLTGISSKLTLQKYARLTPGNSKSLRLSVFEACHPERSEGSALSNFPEQILRRFAPQNDNAIG